MKNKTSFDELYFALEEDYEERYEDDCLDSGPLQYMKPAACYFSVNIFSECEDKLRVTITTKHAFTSHNAVIDDIEVEIKNLHYRSVIFISPGGAAIMNYDPTRVKVWFKEENGNVVIDSIIAG